MNATTFTVDLAKNVGGEGTSDSARCCHAALASTLVQAGWIPKDIAVRATFPLLRVQRDCLPVEFAEHDAHDRCENTAFGSP